MTVDSSKLSALADIANKLRIDSIQMTNASNSGHPTSCCSMAELTSALFFHAMKYTVADPRDPNSDRFVLSKGHCAPILYAAWAEAGLFPKERLMELRRIDSDLEGHPTPRLDFIDFATGSLGQGLGSAAGVAYLGKYVEQTDYKVYCLMGDGESAEGSIWEAAAFASFYKLDNLIAIIDVNRLGQSDSTALGHQMDVYKARWDSFGFNSLVIDGHDIAQVVDAYDQAKATTGRPTIILAKTFKGAGITGISNEPNWHGKALGDKAPAAIQEISSKIKDSSITGAKLLEQYPNKPTCTKLDKIITPTTIDLIGSDKRTSYQLGEVVATRMAYGVALEKLGHVYPHVVALDADVKNSTYSDKFKKSFPNRFVDCFIAEQNMVSVAIGMAARQRTVAFVSTFAAFLSRAYDQIRMGAISMTQVKFCGSHVGVSIGEDGPSQMALEDLAMFRSIPESTVFYPSDAVSTEWAVQLAATTPGVAYIRTSRPNTPVIYSMDEKFSVGQSKVVKKGTKDNVLLIGAGVTLHEILKACQQLDSDKFSTRVLDVFCVKPLDVKTILENARECGGHVVTVEDHYVEGGIYEAVSGALAKYKDISVQSIAVKKVPRSGKPDELVDLFGISANKITEFIKNMSIF